MTKTLILKNYFLVENKQTTGLYSFLTDQKLHGKLSRNRTRFLNTIIDRVKEVNGERIRLIEERADRNKKKEIIFIDKDGKETKEKGDNTFYKISDTNLEKVNTEFTKYLDEDYKIDITEANKEILIDVASIVLNTQTVFTGKEAFNYSEWCDAFENMLTKKK